MPNTRNTNSSLINNGMKKKNQTQMKFFTYGSFVSLFFNLVKLLGYVKLIAS